MMSGGELAALYRVATDEELSILDRISIRAGLIWVCPVEPWNNDVGQRCDDCYRTQEEAAAYMKMTPDEQEADNERMDALWQQSRS